MTLILVTSLQKFFVLLLFLTFVRTDWIHPAHRIELLRRNVRQMADEQHQLPVVDLFVLAAPGWHSGHANTILDDVEDLAVGEPLALRTAHIGRFWIKTAAHLRVAAAIVGVAAGAM